MKCPFCGHSEDKVIESRSISEETIIRRRRECEKCHQRFTSYERIEERPLMVVKKGGQRELFNRDKTLSGIIKACEKRPISADIIAEIVDDIEKTFFSGIRSEIDSSEIGKMVMKKLNKLDKVAYVRFASVYREFKDIDEFAKEINTLQS